MVSKYDKKERGFKWEDLLSVRALALLALLVFFAIREIYRHKLADEHQRDLQDQQSHFDRRIEESRKRMQMEISNMWAELEADAMTNGATNGRVSGSSTSGESVVTEAKE